MESPFDTLPESRHMMHPGLCGDYDQYRKEWMAESRWIAQPDSYAAQPMVRYLEEESTPLFTASNPRGFNMRPFSPLPRFALNCVEPSSHISGQSQSKRYPSPSYSGYSSSQTSSDSSDRERTPYSSPEFTHPQLHSVEDSYYNLSTAYLYGQGGGGPCVSMHDVQQYADAQLDQLAFDSAHADYGMSAQEGYQPMPVEEAVCQQIPVLLSRRNEDAVVVRQDSSVTGPIVRKRRYAGRAAKSPDVASRISGRQRRGKASSSCSGQPLDLVSPRSETSNPKVFLCPFTPYGCQSTFGSKNEWKRHVHTQHMRLGYWRCDQCPRAEHRPNDFNRKDLFIQHVRRMHPVNKLTGKISASKKKNGSRGRKDDLEEAVLNEIAVRCNKKLRSAPQHSSCIFCDANFEGPNSWEERMEHVGRHMEAARKRIEAVAEPSDWREDEPVREWLLDEGLVVKVRGRLLLADR